MIQLLVFELGETNKKIRVVNNYLNTNNLIQNIDYTIKYINSSPTSYTQLFLEYEFIDKSHEDIIRLLLL